MLLQVVLSIGSETKLRNLSKRLTDFYIGHRVWTEQPEDIPTCLVTKPAPKSDKAEFFRKLQLFRLPSDKNKPKDNQNNSANSNKSEPRSGSGGDRVEETKKDVTEKVEEAVDEKVADVKEDIGRMSDSPKLPPIGS